MESNSKRRKIDHDVSGIKKTGIIDFESRNAARVPNASTFMLKTDELLKEAKLDYGNAMKDMDTLLHQLKGIIDAIEPHNPIPVSNHPQKKTRCNYQILMFFFQINEATIRFEKRHRIVIPYPDPKPEKEAPYKLAFSPPSQCNVVGSYVMRTMTKSQNRFGVDMVVQMPKSLFQDKDYANMRYFYRRSYYIAYVAAHVQKELGETMEFRFEYLHENPLLPILVLRSPAKVANSKSNNKSQKNTGPIIRIIPCAADDLFPFTKLTACSANLRTETASNDSNPQTASPFYNSTINAEKTFIQYLRVLANAKKECSAFTDSCMLGRIWLQQRGFGSTLSQGGFGHFEWSIMTALLLKMGGRNGQAALSTSLSSMELFKAAVQFLSTTDFTKKPFAFGVPKLDTDRIKETGPVMFDPIREVNILFKMSPSSASLLRMQAKATTDLLADEAADAFDPSFIIKVDVPLQVFDAVFSVKLPQTAREKNPSDKKGDLVDFSTDVQRILKRAYGNRAQLVHTRVLAKKQWKLNSAHSNDNDDRITVGVIFDPSNMSRQMEYGPPAEEQKEAAKFRQFWGDKAELRRFKSGSILECVEWSGKLPLPICQEIAAYILQRHRNVGQDDILIHGDGLANVLQYSNMDKEAFDSVRQAFQSFERDLRNLDDLPLQIRQLSPISSLSRYASVEAPLVGYYKDTVQLMDVNLYFEASSKWPENITAIQEAKVEFLLDLDRRLSAAHEKITTYLGRENRNIGNENLAYLDIIYDTGVAFRLRIHCDLEETLLERQVSNVTLEARVREDAERVLHKFQWLFNVLPVHTQTIASFCTRLHPLSSTIRLVKHWFACHKLSMHFSEELIELIVLHVFMQPYPWQVPSSASTGFLRTLFFLSRWNWREEPLIIDSAEEMTLNDRSSIQAELDTRRKRDPSMNHTVIMAATSFEQSGLAYTRDGPSKIIASRMTRLAKAAAQLVREQGANLDSALLFETALHDYDVLIHVSSKALRSITREVASDSGARIPSQYKNLDVTTGKIPLPIRDKPINVLVAELQRAFEDTLLFFPGGAEDDAVVAALWNPRLQRQKFRVGLPYNFCNAGDDAVEVNKKAVLLEVARVGGSLFRHIEEVVDNE